MSEQEIYFEEQEYNKAMEIMSKNVMDVTPEDLQFVINYGLARFNKKTYIMPGWQEVVNGTTLNDIIHIKPKVKVARSKTVTKTFNSSSSDAIYTTNYYPDSDKYHCNCPGTWRTGGNCKHIKQMRNDKNN